MTTATLEHPGSAVLVVGAGANTQHFRGALENVRASRPVVVGEVRPVDPGLVPHSALHRLDQEAGQQALEAMMNSGEISATYLSTPPQHHLNGIRTHLGHAAAGNLDFVVATKPTVRDIAEMRAVDQHIRTLETQRGIERLGDQLFTHEHYLFKESWRVFSEQLDKVVDHLGRPTSVTVRIQEKRTIEGEGRGVACADGAFGDLAPHAISLGLDAAAGINESDSFEVAGTSQYTPLERVRDEDSQLDPGVESGFRFKAVTEIKAKGQGKDGKTPESYELPFTLQGGKGLIDKKEVVINFVNETGEVSTVTVDFIKNMIDVPPEIAHLFPQTDGFQDNGYGESVARGLMGDPSNNFQSWSDSRKVIKIMGYLQRISHDAPISYPLRPEGQSIEDILDVQ